MADVVALEATVEFRISVRGQVDLVTYLRAMDAVDQQRFWALTPEIEQNRVLDYLVEHGVYGEAGVVASPGVDPFAYSDEPDGVEANLTRRAGEYVTYAQGPSLTEDDHALLMDVVPWYGEHHRALIEGRDPEHRAPLPGEQPLDLWPGTEERNHHVD